MQTACVFTIAVLFALAVPGQVRGDVQDRSPALDFSFEDSDAASVAWDPLSTTPPLAISVGASPAHLDGVTGGVSMLNATEEGGLGSRLREESTDPDLQPKASEPRSRELVLAGVIFLVGLSGWRRQVDGHAVRLPSSTALRGN